MGEGRIVVEPVGPNSVRANWQAHRSTLFLLSMGDKDPCERQEEYEEESNHCDPR